MKQVLLLKAGDANNAVRIAHGDYDRWFVQTIGQDGVSFDVVHAHLGQKLPDAKAYDAIIMTGSPLSMTDPAEWMRNAGAWLREAGERGTPVLGVCFGHQVLAYAYGAKVVRNPKGREIGTVEVDHTKEGARDRLFDGLPDRITVQATHEDIVPSAPAGATVLAANEVCAVQAFGIGRNVRAVQFHPEAPPATMGALIRARADKLGPPERVRSLLAGVRPTPHGERILRNFLAHF